MHQADAKRALAILAGFGGVFHPRMIHRRQPHRDAPAFGFFDICRNVVEPRARAAHGGKKFRRMMRFQIGHAVRDVGIRGGVRFAEAEAGEFLDHLPGFFALVLCQSHHSGSLVKFSTQAVVISLA